MYLEENLLSHNWMSSVHKYIQGADEEAPQVSVIPVFLYAFEGVVA